jgi:hypothetical protein
MQPLQRQESFVVGDERLASNAITPDTTPKPTASTAIYPVPVVVAAAHNPWPGSTNKAKSGGDAVSRFW